MAVPELMAAACLLLYLIGWQTLMGVLFLIALIPCMNILSSICAQMRDETADDDGPPYFTNERACIWDPCAEGACAGRILQEKDTRREKVSYTMTRQSNYRRNVIGCY